MANGTQVRSNLGGVRLRKNILKLTAQELNDFRNALEGLYEVSAQGGNDDERGYQWIAGIHGFPAPVYCQHGNLNFPTWHRAYLYEYEQRLQDQNPNVMLPYWEWDAEDASTIGIPPAFADQTYVDLVTGDTKPNPLYSAFSQVTGNQTSRNPGPDSGLAPLRQQVIFAEGQQTYDRFSPALEQPHNGLHVWVGGDMGSVPRSSYDPIFYCHHCNVDRQWFEWQRQNGNSTVPDSVKNWVTAPFNYTGEQTLDAAFFGYTYADGEYTVEDEEVTMEPGPVENCGYVTIPVPDRDYKHGLIEFQGLRKAESSLVINVALGKRKSVGEDDYDARFVILGHGKCPGGPGHCTPIRPGYYDKRLTHHLVPFDSYQDLSKPLKKYQEENGDSVDLTFYITDQDGEPYPIEKLEYEGISIVTYR